MTTRAPGMSLAEWMTHGAGGGGGKNKYLKDWKEKGFAHVWFHPAASILSLWRHPFVKLFVNENKETRVATREVSYDSLVCFEGEDVLESQYFRTDPETERNAKAPNGVRKVPPRVCPICIMQEHLVGLVRDGKIDWRTPLFKFEGTDPRKSRLYHVGGFTGLFNGKDLPPERLAELSGAESTDPAKLAQQRAGKDPWFPASKWLGPIYQKGDSDNVAFKQDCRAKQEFVFTVVDNDDAASGAQVMFGGKGLGGKVITVIKKAITEARTPSDPEGTRGDPQRHPYVIRLEYNAQAGARNPNDYYDAMKMGQIAMTPAVHKILASAPPDVAKIADKFNLKTIRARLEQHMLVKLPLDSYFAKAFEYEARQKSQAPAPAAPAERVPEVGRNPGSVGTVVDAGVERPYGQPPAQAVAERAQFAPPPEEAMFGCDDCGNAMRASDPVCGKCGKQYVVESAPPAPPPPVLPKRSSAAAAPPPAAIAAPEPDPWQLAPGSVAAPAGPSATTADYFPEPSRDDDIPF